MENHIVKIIIGKGQESLLEIRINGITSGFEVNTRDIDDLSVTFRLDLSRYKLLLYFGDRLIYGSAS
jgi:hypothetical protein